MTSFEFEYHQISLFEKGQAKIEEMIAVNSKQVLDVSNEEYKMAYPLREVEPWMLALVPSGKYVIEIGDHLMVLKPTLLKAKDVPNGHHFYHFIIGNTVYSGVFVGTELE